MKINILQYLEGSIRTVPDKIAFTDQHSQITYKVLGQKSKRIGSEIYRKTNGQIRQPIVVFVDRNIESLVAFMAVAYSGNFYVPIDIKTPKGRVELILETLQPLAVIVTKESKSLSEKVARNLIAIDYEINAKGVIDEQILKNVRNKIIDKDPIYATFTSGSTGIPKGVLTCHQSVVDMTEALCETFDFSEENVFGNQNPFYFDASIKDIYCTLKCGATMHILPKAYFIMLSDLVNYIVDHKVDTILWSAAAIALLANSQAFDDKKPNTLKNVMFSGEVMHNKVLNYWRENLPNTKFVNLYGPTEITSVCTYFKIKKSYKDDDVLPIGIPFRNCDVLILNDDNKLVRGDEIGELCVKGSCLALGYYNNAEKTTEAFCQNPLNLSFPELIYRTGDIAKFNEFGDVMFVSRKDNQVKHMGQRVEIGEIEIILNAMEKIDASICFYDHKLQKIVGIFQGEDADSKYIYTELRDKVPKFMFPNILIKQAGLPYSMNGKIDRSLLKEQYETKILN